MVSPRSASIRLALVALACAAFVALAWPGAGTRGILAEEVQPYLERYPLVLDWRARGTADGSIAPIPPYEEGAAPRPRWVATSQWPVIAYDGERRMWPVFIRGHQTALASYVGIALGPALGGGIAGARRSTVLLGLVVVAMTALFAMRTRRAAAPWAAAIVALSFGMISIARTAEAFEVGSRAAMMVAVVLLAPRGPPSLSRSALAGVAAGAAVLSRATIVTALAPVIVVLLARRDSRPDKRAVAILIGLGALLPVVVVGALGLVVPFQSGQAPLAGFPYAQLPARALGAPRQLLLALSWLGDANAVWGPLARGEMSLGPTLWLPAALASVPVAAAVVRAARGRAGVGERMLLAALLSSVILGSLLYADENQFQLALALEPFFALAIAEQVTSLFDRYAARRDRRAALVAWAAGAIAIAARAQGAFVGLGHDATNSNPMLSGRAQRAAVEEVRRLGLRGAELMTTVYNQAGVIEGWTRGDVRPAHAWPALSGSPSEHDCDLQDSWRELLGRYRPRYVLLTEGPNLFESGGMDPPAIARSLRRAAEVAGIEVAPHARFPTESGGPGWALVRLVYPEPLPIDASSGELAADPACAARTARRRAAPVRPVRLERFAGLSPGDRVLDFEISAIERAEEDQDPTVRIQLRRNETTATLEVRPDTGGSSPPARGGGYAVFYRNEDRDRLGVDELVRVATALAARMDQASGGAP